MVKVEMKAEVLSDNIGGGETELPEFCMREAEVKHRGGDGNKDPE